MQARLQQSRRLGSACEHLLAPEFFESRGWSYMPSSIEENIYKHFDAKVRNNGREYKIEIKAVKTNKNPQYSSQQLLLFEWQGITGHPGWLHGEADYIFQQLTANKIVIYSRLNALNKLSPPLLPISRFWPQSAPLGQWFGREGLTKNGKPNQDIICWEPLSFLDGTKHRFYVKQKGNWLPL